MNTVQLECFIAVSEHLNFSKAAQMLKMTQPAVSHQINSLETELDVKLFMRTSKSVTITRAGLQFIGPAKNILTTMNSAKQRLNDGKTHEDDFLCIGGNSEFELAPMPEIVRQMKKDIPNVKMSIKNIPSFAMQGQLVDGNIHALLGFKIKKASTEPINYQELTKCPIVCVCTKDYPLAAYDTLSEKDLSGMLIFNEPDRRFSVLTEYQNRVLSDRTFKDACMCTGYSAVMAMVKSGVGFSIVPDMPSFRDDALAYIPIKEFQSVSFGVYYRTIKEKPVIKHFIHIARNVCGG